MYPSPFFTVPRKDEPSPVDSSRRQPGVRRSRHHRNGPGGRLAQRLGRDGEMFTKQYLTIYDDICTNVCIYIYICIYVCIYVCIYRHTYTNIYIYIHIHIHTYTYAYAYAYTYIYIHAMYDICIYMDSWI